MPLGRSDEEEVRGRESTKIKTNQTILIGQNKGQLIERRIIINKQR